MGPLKISEVISEQEIQKRVSEIATDINKKFKGDNLIAIGVLKGSFMFYADLIRQIDGDVNCEFLGVSSYEKMHTSGEVKMHLDLTTSVRDRHVLLIEDIVDTGLTMNYLIKNIKLRQAKSVTSVSLLLKPDALREACEVDYVGFKLENNFVVGYGLDYQGHYRNLPYIAQVQSLN